MMYRLAVLAAAASTAVATANGKLPSRLAGRDDGDGIWCGAVQTNEASGQFNQVSGTWSVPQITLRDGQDPNSGPAFPIWVGIDGWGCAGLLQAGTTSILQADGSVSTDVWIEYFPAPAVFQGWTVNVGDQITVSIQATSSTSGDVTITNNSNGQTTTQTINSPDGTQLCNTAVEWVAEWSGGGTPVFPDMTITAGGDNNPGNAGGATLVHIQQSGVPYCDGSVDGDGNVVLHSD